MALSDKNRLASMLKLLPLVLLLIGLSTIPFFGSVDGAFNKRYLFSEQHLALAMNLSPSHHFLGYLNQVYDLAGNISIYEPYNRHSPGSYLLINLATFAVSDKLTVSVVVAQILMMMFFAGAMMIAYWSLCRLISNRWIASTAVLLGFSSSIMLTHATAITPEVMPGLFGFLLTFHGMVIFIQEGRFHQLVIKACLALLLDWRVLALLLPFILLSFAKEIIQARKVNTGKRLSLSLYLWRVTASHYFTLGFVVLGLGILILAYNIANEYYALNFRGDSQLILSDLPSVESALRRTGMEDPGEGYEVQWDVFIYSQLERLSYLTSPFDLPFNPWLSRIGSNPPWAALAGIGIVGVCVIGAVHLKRHRLLALTAVLSGFFWSIPMRHNTHVNGTRSEILYYIGVTLFLYTLILLWLDKWSGKGKWLSPLAAAGALSIFVISSYRVAYSEIENTDDVAFINIENSVANDAKSIRQFTEKKNILIYSSSNILIRNPHGYSWYPYIWPYGGLFYYLRGSGLIFDSRDCRTNSYKVDFILQPKQDGARGLLTPDNRVMYLYDRHVYEEPINRIVESRPVVRGGFDVYLTDDRILVYVGDRCTEDLRLLSNPVHVMVYPVAADDLSDSSQDHELYSFTLANNSVMDARRYVMTFDLPDYDIASIVTGQSSSEGYIWGGGFFGPDHVADAGLHQRADQITNHPLIETETRGYFDVYLTDDRKNLLYVREQCHNGDISDDFFVHVFPVDRMDLPDHRRQSGFDNLDFAFIERGSIDGQRCVAEIRLPDYDIASISTGQFTNQGQTWQSELNAAG